MGGDEHTLYVLPESDTVPVYRYDPELCDFAVGVEDGECGGCRSFTCPSIRNSNNASIYSNATRLLCHVDSCMHVM